MKSTNSDERAASNLFKKFKGDIILSKATCLTNIVSISDYVRPVFTESFISGLESINQALLDDDEDRQNKEYVSFIKEFGTFYMKHTSMGSQLIYERRFTDTASTKEEMSERNECSKKEASASVNAGGYGAYLNAQLGQSSSECKSSRNDEKFKNEEKSDTKRILSRGSRPGNLKDWLTSDFTPVPIHRVLRNIKDLLKDEWLSKNDAYGFRQSLNGNALRTLFTKNEKDYCKLFLSKILNEDCSNKGNIM